MSSNCTQIQSSLNTLLSLRDKYLEAFSDVDERKGHRDPGNKQAVESSLSLMEEITKKIQEFESNFYVSLEKAQEIMDKSEEQNFMGPEQIKIAFGIEVKDIPKIPFSREELDRAKELGQMLILRVDKSPDGQPLTMKKINQILQIEFEKQDKGNILDFNDDFHVDYFDEETPQLGWALVSKEVIPDSTSSNYLIQTEKLINYFKDQVFEGQDIPEIYQQAIEEFQSKKDNINKLLDQDWQKASPILENLQITQLLRQSPVEVLYDLMIYFQNSGKRLLRYNYSWSRHIEDDKFVRLGIYDNDGIVIYIAEPSEDSMSTTGVCFSRRF